MSRSDLTTVINFTLFLFLVVGIPFIGTIEEKQRKERIAKEQQERQERIAKAQQEQEEVIAHFKTNRLLFLAKCKYNLSKKYYRDILNFFEKYEDVVDFDNEFKEIQIKADFYYRKKQILIDLHNAIRQHRWDLVEKIKDKYNIIPFSNDFLEAFKLAEEKQELRDRRNKERWKAAWGRQKRREEVPKTEEGIFLRDKGHYVTHKTKYTSDNGTSNTYWIGNKAYTFDNEKLTSTYESD
jgi:hypothetical protein